MANAAKYILVGINYWPEPTGNSPYNTGLAEKLEESGEVCVITGIPHYPWWSKQRDHSDTTYLEKHVNILLTRVNHYVPRKQSNIHRALMEIDFGLKAIASRKLSGDKIVLVSPAMISSAIVLAWVRIFNRDSKVLLWVQDLYEQGIEETTLKRGALTKAVIKLENWLLSNADRVVVAHPRFLEAKKLTGDSKKYLAQSNWSQFIFEPNMTIEATRQKYGFGDSEIILHIGNMGVKQGLESVLASAKLALLDLPNLKFVFVGAGNQLEKLRNSAFEDHLTNVFFFEPVTEVELSNLMNAANVLLVHESPGVKEMSIPSKLSTYFLTGRPVLVCSEPDSLAGRAVQEDRTGFWVKSGEPRLLLLEIEHILMDTLSGVGKRAMEFATKNLRKEQSLERFKKLIDEI
jgi:glycosyltransferase involved in cell wall biosynthesis